MVAYHWKKTRNCVFQKKCEEESPDMNGNGQLRVSKEYVLFAKTMLENNAPNELLHLKFCMHSNNKFLIFRLLQK